MSRTSQPLQTLSQWLERIQQLHPQEIDLGLERVKVVADRLGLTRPAPYVITVTGTNGKGSHVATLDALFRHAGLRVGCYTSPHLLRYNERVCVQGEPVADQELVEAFDRIEAARGEVSLTYFEFGTLAALMIFERSALDVAVLEVGMGGRLDAVNIIDADLAIVTHIDLDHQEWLGNTREAIAQEKAGIFRAGKPVVCAEANPPSTLIAAADSLGCPLYLPGRDYHWRFESDLAWTWQGVIEAGSTHVGSTRAPIELKALPAPALALYNVASALQAALLSGLITEAVRDPLAWSRAIAPVLQNLQLAGRQQWLPVAPGQARVMVDVAHNPHAAQALADRLEREKKHLPANSRVHLVVAMMADKDHSGFYRALEKQVDFWYIAHFDLARCLPANDLADIWRKQSAASANNATDITVFASVAEAFAAASQRADVNDMVVVCGSFITVADAMAAHRDQH